MKKKGIDEFILKLRGEKKHSGQIYIGSPTR